MYTILLLFLAVLETVVGYHGLSSTPSRPRSADGEMNDGYIPTKRFNATEQYVDTSGIHRFLAPGRKDIRGPCPALNAAANHAYISHSGVVDFNDFISFANLYGGDQELFFLLFNIAIVATGSIEDMKFSIGGPSKSSTVLGGGSRGLSNTHTTFEGDASPTRLDTFVNNGDSHSLSLDRYTNMLSNIGTNDNYGMASARAHLQDVHDYSIHQNPLAFFGAFPFSFVTIAHTFIPAFFSNHSKENIGGVLPRHVLNSFFAVKENVDGTLKWQRGREQIPKNWYRRSKSNRYGFPAVNGDLIYSYTQIPSITKIGGNKGKPNTFTEIPLDILTSGAYYPGDLLLGANAVCFMFQTTLCLRRFGPQPPSPIPSCSCCSGTLRRCRTMDRYRADLYKKFPGFTTKPPLQPARPY